MREMCYLRGTNGLHSQEDSKTNNEKYCMDKKKIAALCIVVASMGAAWAQGGITPEMLSQMRDAEAALPQSTAIANALASNKIDDLAQTRAAKAGLDDHFSVVTPDQPIHNQMSSGRCWMFSGLNVLRADYALANADTMAVEFSHNYLFFFDQLEKANLMLQGVIDHADKDMEDERVRFFFKHPVSDGGTFCGIIDLASKYGLVPKSVFPETFSAENTSKMSQIVNSKLREFGLELRAMVAADDTAEAITARKTEMLAEIYHILSLALGEPPTRFEYIMRNNDGTAVSAQTVFTPEEFFNITVGRDLSEQYIMVMNDPRRPYHKTYEVEYDRHTYDGHNWVYLNLPVEEIEQLAIASLKDGRKMYSSYDVGKQLDRKRGYLALDNYDYASLFGTTFDMNKAERIATFDSGSTHAMTIDAVDLDADGRPLKWRVENSWGSTSGQAGKIIMTADWFKEYMFRLVVDKKYVPKKLLKEYEQEPVLVMPEDPLFGADD